MRKISLIMIIIMAQSCLGGSDYYRDRVAPFLNNLKPNYRPQMVDGVMEPEVFPDLEEDQKTLVGIDSNHDGVRDDMEIFINRNFRHQVERENYKNAFKRSINFYEHYKKMTLDENVTYESNSSIDYDCISYGLKYLKLTRSPELDHYRPAASLYNTKEREAAFNYNYQKLAGRAYGDGYGDKQIFEACKNRIDQQVINKNEGK